MTDTGDTWFLGGMFGGDSWAWFLSWLGIEVEDKKIESLTQKEESKETFLDVSKKTENVQKIDSSSLKKENKESEKNKNDASPSSVKEDEKKPSEKKTKEPKQRISVNERLLASNGAVPVLSEARVIKKATPVVKEEPTKNQSGRPKKKDTSAVDDLIKKKTGGGYMKDLESWTKRTWGWWTMRFTKWKSRPSAPPRWNTTTWRRTSWGTSRTWRTGRPGRWWNNQRPARPQRPAKPGSIQLWRTQNSQTMSTRDIIAQQTRSKRPKTYKVSDNLKKKETITLWETITVKEFSEKMWVPLPEVMKVLLMNKIIVAAQASIDFDTAQLIWEEFGVTLEKETWDLSVTDVLEANLESILAQDKEETTWLLTRPPIVTIMGHVDHGKTKLLDYLRKTDIVWWEAWGITQSIWASQVVHDDQKITFIDTPGHALFSSLRARGSKITNIVVIVVAADDGVKPQTVEAIRHAKDAWVPIIVAITKVDLWNKRMDEIKWQLSENWLTPEDRGGETMIVPCSAMTGQGIDDLLDTILLQTEMLELQYNPKRDAIWVVLEVNKDARKWVQTTLLIMTGTLRVWDVIAIHDTYGRVRKMTDWKWADVTEATWWDTVMILWVNDVPEPWRMAEVVWSDKEAQKKIALIQEHQDKHKNEVALQSILDRISKWDAVQLKLILKADSFGSLEAIKHSTTKIPLPKNVEIKVIHDDVWGITDSDLAFAKAANALVIWYNVPLPWPIRKKAAQDQIQLKQYDIIYEFMEYIEDLSKWLIEVEKVETLIWKMKVLALFFKKGKEMIVWGKIIEWKVENRATFKVMRDDDQWANWRITSLQREKDSVKEVKEGYECGIKIRTSKKILVDDIIEFYTMQEVKEEA